MPGVKTLSVEQRKTVQVKIAYLRELNSSQGKMIEGAKAGQPLDVKKYRAIQSAAAATVADLAGNFDYKIRGG